MHGRLLISDMCRQTTSTELYVPLLAHGCVIGPCPPREAAICLCLACNGQSAAKDWLSRVGKEAWRSWGEDLNENEKDEKTSLLCGFLLGKLQFNDKNRKDVLIYLWWYQHRNAVSSHTCNAVSCRKNSPSNKIVLFSEFIVGHFYGFKSHKKKKSYLHQNDLLYISVIWVNWPFYWIL